MVFMNGDVAASAFGRLFLARRMSLDQFAKGPLHVRLALEVVAFATLFHGRKHPADGSLASRTLAPLELFCEPIQKFCVHFLIGCAETLRSSP